MDLRPFVLVHRPVARAAVPAGFERRPADRVPARLGVLGPGRSPFREERDRARKLPAPLAQLVLDPARALRVRSSDDERLALEVPKALREDVRGDAADGLGKLVEPLWTLQ